MRDTVRRLAGKVWQKGPVGCLRSAVARLHGLLHCGAATAVRRAAWATQTLAAARAVARAAAFRGCAALLHALGVRFLFDVFLHRIGHLACEIDCYVKEGILGQRPPQVGVVLVPPGTVVANECLLRCWQRYVWVVRSPWLCRLLGRFQELSALRHSVYPYVYAMDATARYPAVQAAYADRPPLLRLTRAQRARGEARLRALGVPAGAWYVGVHCRESGYTPHEPAHDFRNAAVENYFPAMAAVVERGGFCIRLGDPTMKPLPPLPGVIDYAHSPLRSDWMDVFLCAGCKFFLGSASGLGQVAGVFGVPCATANQAPLSVVYNTGPHDLNIPKLFWSASACRYLTFAELLAGPLGNARYARVFAEAAVTVVENSPADIRDLALEMLEQVNGTPVRTATDERLQDALRRLFRPGHYSYGAAGRVGRSFLRKYRALLPETAEAAPEGAGRSA